jgi:hypothetical protein
LRGSSNFWQLAFGKRPNEELYHIVNDPYCVDNLAQDENLKDLKTEMASQLEQELTEQGDPRLLGQGSIFDQYKYMDKKTADFYNRFMAGEELNAGWVEKSDFEKETLE